MKLCYMWNMARRARWAEGDVLHSGRRGGISLIAALLTGTSRVRYFIYKVTKYQCKNDARSSVVLLYQCFLFDYFGCVYV